MNLALKIYIKPFHTLITNPYKTTQKQLSSDVDL